MAEAKDYSAEALLAKEKEVELDTDDVKEESVEVEEKSETKKEPNLNLSPKYWIEKKWKRRVRKRNEFLSRARYVYIWYGRANFWCDCSLFYNK